jgi:hypothetical protein
MIGADEEPSCKTCTPLPLLGSTQSFLESGPTVPKELNIAGPWDRGEEACGGPWGQREWKRVGRKVCCAAQSTVCLFVFVLFCGTGD